MTRLRRASDTGTDTDTGTGTDPGTDTGTDTGFSLIELLVVMVLMSILGGVVAATFIQGSKATRSADARSRDGAYTRLALEDAAKVLRTAVDPDGRQTAHEAFVVAKPTEAVFYAALGTKGASLSADGDPTMVHVWLEPTAQPGIGELREQRFAPVATVSGEVRVLTWPTGGPVRVIARDVVMPPTRPIFTYLGTGDLAIDASTGRAASTLATDDSGALVASALSNVHGVEMWLQVRSSPQDRADATTAVTRVTLLNKD